MKTLLTTLCLSSIVVLHAACGDGGSSSTEGSGGTSATSGDPSGTGGSSASSGGGTGGGGGGGGGVAECGAITTFADGLSPTKELHVAPGGSDAQGDGSQGNPFATIEHAAGLATPGTAVRVHAGTYAGGGYITDLSGQDGAPIWIGGAPGEARPVIEGGGEALHLTRVRYLVVHDLEVRNTDQNGINCDDGADYANPDASRFIVFKGLFVHDIGSGGNQDCIKLSGLNDFFVLDSEIAACGGAGAGSAVDHVGCHKGLIARNHIHDLGSTGVQCKGGSEDIEIRWNRFVNAGQRPVNMGGSTGFEFFRPPLSMSEPNAEARDIRVVANVFQGGECAAAFVGCDGCLLANNTVVDPQSWFFRILQETVTGGGYEFVPSRGGKVMNNLFYFDRAALSAQDVNVGGNTAPETFTVSNNLWYAHDDPGASAPKNLPVAEAGAVVGEDPKFSGGMGDYHIDAASPAAGKGMAPPGAPGDVDGTCYAAPPSIGAYEVK